jgi:hypothetical protein
MSCKFSLFIFLISLYIFQIYGVFINKVLQGCINFIEYMTQSPVVGLAIHKELYIFFIKKFPVSAS